MRRQPKPASPAEPLLKIPEHIRALRAYKPESCGPEIRYKLDAMEYPYPLEKGEREELLRLIAKAEPRLYPAYPEQSETDELLKSLGLQAERCLLGNGSDELIQSLMLLAGGSRARVLRIEPGFAMFGLIARALGAETDSVDLNPDFTLNLEKTLEAVESFKPSMIIIASPNNPTANSFPAEELARLSHSAPGLFVLDQAYHDYSGSKLDYSTFSRSTVYLRTLSKVGFAGLRLGLVAGPAEIIDQLAKLRLPYSIGGLTAALIPWIFERRQNRKQKILEICSERDKLARELSGLALVEQVFPSESNFLTARFHKPAGEIHGSLLSRGILVRNLEGFHRLTRCCLRITLGTPEANLALLETLAELGS